jgi:hypothetical protein
MDVSSKLKVIAGIAGGCLALSASMALAADFYEPPPAEAAAAPAPAPTPWSVGIEFSPEWKQTPGSEGDWADWYFKPSISYTFASGFVWGGSFQDTIRPDGEDPGYQLETTLGYKWKVSKSFTLTPAAGVGLAFGRAKIDPSDAENDAWYYLVSLAGDLKLSKKWTWNVFNVRWRDAFEYKWETPKVATGITYAITSTDSIYTNVGYGWKNGVADKINWAVGYKHAF